MYKYLYGNYYKFRRGRDRMVLGFTTTYAISAYHHWCCEFESRSGRSVQHYVIKICQWLATGRLFSANPPVSSTNKTDRHDITEILLKMALNTINQTNKQYKCWFENNHSSNHIVQDLTLSFYSPEEEFKDTQEKLRSCKSKKYRQFNRHVESDKKTNNSQQNTSDYREN